MKRAIIQSLMDWITRKTKRNFSSVIKVENKSVVMKIIIISIFIFLFSRISFCQYNGALDYFFFKRHPSARAESMGRSFVSNGDDAGSIFYNPAGLSQINGFQSSINYASPLYALTKAKYLFFSSSYKIKNYSIVGLAVNHLTFGEEFLLTTTNFPDGIGEKFTPFITNYTLTFASQPIHNLHFGINSNYLFSSFGAVTGHGLFMDIGSLKK